MPQPLRIPSSVYCHPLSPDAEDIFIEGELLAELMQELHDKHPREDQIVMLNLDAKEKKAIIDIIRS